ncbi:MAG: STAS/SEC14 domain-containing protein [Bacteroidetes bacterium]|nr:STAS/SEC14 domain-containing protein [Bacteroidota bacterium]
MGQREPKGAIYTEIFTTWLDESGICRTVVKKNGVIGLTDAQENTIVVGKVSGDKLRPLLVDLRKIKSIDKPARDHFAMHGRQPGVCAIGMLIRTPLSKVIGNFFLGINKPVVPTQLFNSEAAALEWLKKFIIKS